MKTMKLIAPLAVVLALPALAGAQCADPNNLLTADNCGFDTAASVGPALGAWDATPTTATQTLLMGTASHSASGGRTSPGSMLMTSADNGGFHITGFEICVPGAVADGTVVGFGLHANTDALLELGYLTLTPTNSDCTASVGGSASVTVAPPAPGSYANLNPANTTLSVPAGTQALKLEVLCGTSGGPYTMNIDDAYIGENMVPVELMPFSVN